MPDPSPSRAVAAPMPDAAPVIDEGRVYAVLCTAGDLISVPANTQHWFDAGTHPSFTAVRIFTDTSGWVPSCC